MRPWGLTWAKLLTQKNEFKQANFYAMANTSDV